MSDTTDPELCFLITNVCEPSKNFDFPETEQFFRFAWFKKFRWVCYSRWDDRTCCLPCVLFGHKNLGKSLQKSYQKWQTAVKMFKKHQNVPTGTHKNRPILFHRFSHFNLLAISYNSNWHCS